MMRLNIGSGEDPLENFTNVDIRLVKGTDVGCDCRHLPFIDGAFNFLNCSDVIEHVGRHECHDTLVEWRRVLKDKGKIRIKTPCLNTIIRLASAGVINDFELTRLLYASQDHEHNFHRNGFTLVSLDQALIMAGFSVAHVRAMDGNDVNNMEAVATK